MSQTNNDALPNFLVSFFSQKTRPKQEPPYWWWRKKTGDAAGVDEELVVSELLAMPATRRKKLEKRLWMEFCTAWRGATGAGVGEDVGADATRGRTEGVVVGVDDAGLRPNKREKMDGAVVVVADGAVLDDGWACVLPKML